MRKLLVVNSKHAEEEGEEDKQMAKLIPYDVTGVEDGGGGTGVKAPLGLYVAEITLCHFRDKNAQGGPANDIRVGLNVGAEYDWLFTYIGLGESSDWKLKQFTRAVGLKDKGNIDTDKLLKKKLRVKVDPDTYGGEYAPRAGNLFPLAPGDGDVGRVSELSGSDDNGSGPAAEAETKEGTGTEGFVPSRESDPDVGSYDDWEDDDLTAEAEDRGVTIPGGRGNKRDKVIAALRADDAEPPAEAEADTSGASDNGAGGDDDYENWSLEELKGEWEERQMGDVPSVRGRNAEARTITAMAEALHEDDNANPFNA